MPVQTFVTGNLMPGQVPGEGGEPQDAIIVNVSPFEQVVIPLSDEAKALLEQAWHSGVVVAPASALDGVPGIRQEQAGRG